MSTKVYVGNIPFTATNDELLQLFGKDGRNCIKVEIKTDRDTGAPRGFAFVEFATANDAAGAIESLNGSTLGTRTIAVAEARPKIATPRYTVEGRK